MESTPAIEGRVEKLTRNRLERLAALTPQLVVEPRDPRGVRHPLPDLAVGMVAAALKGGSAIRHVEKFTSSIRLGYRGKGISDGALTHLLARAPADLFKALLVQAVKDGKRRNELAPDGLAQHWTTIDGKYSVYDHHCGGLGQKFEGDGKVWWRLGTLRAMLVSAKGRTMLGLRAMPPARAEATAAVEDNLKHTGETTNLLPFVQDLRRSYGDLCENFTVDAGLWSKELFLEFNSRGLGLFAGLKVNRGDLFVEATRLLNIARRTLKPMAESEWEPSRGGTIRRRLWRTNKLEDWMGWKHLRQVILVEQTTMNNDGEIVHVEDRYFVTNMTVGALTPSQALTLVRRHWAIAVFRFLGRLLRRLPCSSTKTTARGARRTLQR